MVSLLSFAFSSKKLLPLQRKYLCRESKPAALNTLERKPNWSKWDCFCIGKILFILKGTLALGREQLKPRKSLEIQAASFEAVASVLWRPMHAESPKDGQSSSLEQCLWFMVINCPGTIGTPPSWNISDPLQSLRKNPKALQIFLNENII